MNILKLNAYILIKSIKKWYYFVLSTLVATALTRFQRELAGIVGSHLTDEQRAKLDALLDKAPTDLDDGYRYRLTLLAQWKRSYNLTTYKQ